MDGANDFAFGQMVAALKPLSRSPICNARNVLLDPVYLKDGDMAQLVSVNCLHAIKTVCCSLSLDVSGSLISYHITTHTLQHTHTPPHHTNTHRPHYSKPQSF